MIQREQILESRGASMLSDDGDKVGSVHDIYIDRDTGQPEWALVTTGWFGTKGTFVPLIEARQEGNDIVVPYSSDQVKGAPNMEPDGDLSPQEETDLYNYYGLADVGSRLDREAGGVEGKRASEYETSGRTTDDAMTRSEEELHVGTTEQERGRARLKKYVVTEQVQQTVPVKREEVRIEREPITDSNAEQAKDGPDFSEKELEVVLHEERPVVEKQTVPKERVRLTKENVTDEVEISEDVRKEQIEQEGDIRH